MSGEAQTTPTPPAADEWAQALAEQANTGAEVAKPVAGQRREKPDDYARATLNSLNDEGTDGSHQDGLEGILEIPVTLAMEVGKTQINIRRLLQLTEGSVVELDRLAGESLDVLVNRTLVAHGEVVMVNEKFGLRLTDVVSAQERLKKLR